MPKQKEAVRSFADVDFEEGAMTEFVPDPNQEVILSVRDLDVGFMVRGKKTHVIRNINLDIYKGKTLAIVGESGSGKSVFTKTFTGMLESNGFISNGTIMFEGQDLAKFTTNEQWTPIRGKKIATIFQDPMTSLNPLLSIGYQISEVLILHRGMTKEQARAEAIDLLGKVKIPHPEERYNDKPFQFSGGMRQRAVIAIALACNPEILICDEPTTALDVTVQSQIIDLIKELQKEYGWTTIFITHDLGVVANIADNVAVMYGGQIVEYGTIEDVFYHPEHPYTWALLCSLPQLGTKDEPLTYIKGNPPSFGEEIIGDAFAPRSQYAMNIDFVREPPIFKISDTHWAKTWLLSKYAPKVEKPLVIQELHERMERAAKELANQEGGNYGQEE